MINRRCGRRDFVLAVAGLVATLSMGSTLPAAERLDQELSRGAFLAYLGQTFRVYGGPGLQLVIKMELIEVEDKRIGPQTEQFAILLRHPKMPGCPRACMCLKTRRPVNSSCCWNPMARTSKARITGPISTCCADAKSGNQLPIPSPTIPPLSGLKLLINAAPLRGLLDELLNNNGLWHLR